MKVLLWLGGTVAVALLAAMVVLGVALQGATFG